MHAKKTSRDSQQALREEPVATCRAAAASASALMAVASGASAAAAPHGARAACVGEKAGRGAH
eukprot:CAMPEP_0204129600 /NCGR_PEP_ID=MMETSP0361-20130328/12872_1 /ASSEMBLY_ACC=CAM_ASM_000343 /TAXON_ID=268821 /ORGANISM="Scrippsiella Hangoei, Strain SHTV-5" /LENGTH=62 /DNA_ID=CAMNT_0051082045 /DNA_START=297 /DNA_END=482 /DNA_ORIENTATION=+